MPGVVFKKKRRGQQAVPAFVDAVRAGERPLPGQTRAIGMATNFVNSSDFNRISTARLPFFGHP